MWMSGSRGQQGPKCLRNRKKFTACTREVVQQGREKEEVGSGKEWEGLPAV